MSRSSLGNVTVPREVLELKSDEDEPEEDAA